jgi:molybdopterin molybdotransferase
MDGIAISFASWKKGRREFVVQDTQPAGVPGKSLDDAQQCMEVMTGAVVPKNTDTVIRYEDIEINDGTARLLTDDVTRGQNVHSQGNDAPAESILLEPGVLLSPAEIALLASVGKVTVRVFGFPSVAIVSTGDELVDVDATPQPHQIRKSNTYAIQAAMRTLGWEGTVFHLPDDKERMVTAMKSMVETFKVIILSGGVSKGKFDYVPTVLEEIGITKLFHTVNQRPGKPFWFGVSKEGITVFALPGSPVSTYMCFYRYIRPWLLQSAGIKVDQTMAVLAEDFSFSPRLTYFLQVGLKLENGKLMAYPDPGGGSGDFANLKNVTGFLELPADQTTFAAGELFPYFPFRPIV